jgi:protein TonB
MALAGTLAIHVILLVAADAMIYYHPYKPAPPAPRVELVQVEVPPIVKREPPAPVVREEPKPQPRDEPSAPRPAAARTQAIRTPAPSSEPPPVAPDTPLTPTTDSAPGGDQVVTLDDASPGGVGVPVAVGKRTTQHVGRGGSGGGTGAGSGSGAGDAAPPPVSVATIKKRALPRGDYAYFDAGKDYPPEARQLGIEGPIRVRLVVDDQGQVKSAVLLNKLGHGLDELALERAKKIQFDAARDTDDKVVTSVVVWTFNMTLPK